MKVLHDGTRNEKQVIRVHIDRNFNDLCEESGSTKTVVINVSPPFVSWDFHGLSM